MEIFATCFIVFTELDIPNYSKSTRGTFEKYAPAVTECVCLGFEERMREGRFQLENKYVVKCEIGHTIEEITEQLNAVVEAVAATCDSGKEELAYA